MKGRIGHIIIWILLLAWMTVMMVFVSGARDDLICQGLNIHIPDSADVVFVDEELVRQEIQSADIHTQGYPMKDIDLREIEWLLEKIPYIKNAEVYVNIEGDLNIDIEQRKPVMRVMPEGSTGFYVDKEGYMLPLSEDYSPMSLLVSGHISLKVLEEDEKRIDLKDKQSGDIVDFARFIAENPFWSKQIVQVYKASNGDFEMIPRVGAHQVILGDLDGFDIKFRNLELLYNQGFSETGWNTYDKINLKYSNQIICTKR